MILVPFRTLRHDDPQRHIELLHKLIWLASRDVIFFGEYNEDKEVHDEDAYPCILCNDTFGYATADGESFEAEDIDRVIEVFQKFGFDGVTAWIAAKRGTDLIPPRRTAEYERAREWLKAGRAEKEGA